MAISSAKILVVEDERLIRAALCDRLRAEGLDVREAATLAEATHQLVPAIDLLVLDDRLPDGRGLAALPALLQLSPHMPVIMVATATSVSAAVEAMQAGVWHYFVKPVHLDELLLKIHQALEIARLRHEVKLLRDVVRAPWGLHAMLGESQPMQRVRMLLAKVAATSGATVLLTGESGTGKDLAAKIIHYGGARADKPFMTITCSALQETLLESELFGHEKGAFTDARTQKKGLLEIAAGGTVFLDEIGEMSGPLQAKLLRFLEEKTFKRVGGAQDVAIDVRIVAATNRDLAADVEAGRFRRDLYYRLRVLPIELPPLRERPGDVALLLQTFLRRFSEEFKKPVHAVSDTAVGLLAQLPWLGNVRELRNAVERAVLLADAGELGFADFLLTPVSAVIAHRVPLVLPADGIDVDALQDDLVRQAMVRTVGNQTRAAQLLGLSRDQVRYRLDKMAAHLPSD